MKAEIFFVTYEEFIEIQTKKVAETNIYVVYCDDNYEPIFTEPTSIDTKEITNQIARKILEKHVA